MLIELRASWGLIKKGKYKAKIQKILKLRFDNQIIVWSNFKTQKWIPGKILILLDPHNLSVREKLPK